MMPSTSTTSTRVNALGRCPLIRSLNAPEPRAAVWPPAARGVQITPPGADRSGSAGASILVVLHSARVLFRGGAVGGDGARGLVVVPAVAGGVGGDDGLLALVGPDGQL